MKNLLSKRTQCGRHQGGCTLLGCQHSHVSTVCYRRQCLGKVEVSHMSLQYYRRQCHGKVEVRQKGTLLTQLSFVLCDPSLRGSPFITSLLCFLRVWSTVRCGHCDNHNRAITVAGESVRCLVRHWESMFRKTQDDSMALRL